MAARDADIYTLASSAPWIGTILWLLFVLCIPLFLVGANVRTVTLSPDTYREGFAKYGASRATGLSDAQLEQVATQFIDFFKGQSDLLDVDVERGGKQAPLFNQREIQHMADVHRLMRAVFMVSWISSLYLALYAIGGLALFRSAALGELGLGLMAGAGLTIGLLVLVGMLSTTDFTSLFIQFHQLMFRNDLWMLDPTRDALLLLFPEGFWLDVTLRIAAMTGIECLMAGVLGLVLWRWTPG
jgi:integral membrane protein (TIGR01906 family)